MSSSTSFSIATKRLLLRPFRVDDIPNVHNVLDTDPEVKRYTGGVCSYERTAAYFQGVIQASAQNPQALVRWAVIHRAENRLIGWCGLQPLYFDPPRVELGYGLARAYWGHGLATEAAQAMLDYGFDTLMLPTIVSAIHPNNHASRRVVEKIGMAFRGLVSDGKTGEGSEVRLYEAINPLLPHPFTDNSEVRQDKQWETT